MNTDLLTSLYRSVTGNAPELIEALTGAGSNRSYFRLHGKPTLIGVYGTSVEENQAFTYMAAHFQQKGIPVPKVYACLLYTSPSPRDRTRSRMPSSA